MAITNNLSSMTAFDKKIKEWKTSDSCIKNQFLQRVGNLALAPSELILGVIDTALGAVAACASILTLGKYKPITDFAGEHLESSRFLISKPFACFVKTINPGANFNFDHPEAKGGYFTQKASDKLADRAFNFSNKSSFVKRQIVSRLTYGVFAVATVVARVVDLLIGVFAAALSVLTLGNYEKPNEFAYKGLQVTGIVIDLVFSAIHIINPHAGKN